MMLSKYQKLTLYTIVLAALIRFAILPLTSISGDACWHTSVSRFIGENSQIPLFEGLGRPVFWAPPLFHIVSGTFYSALGPVGLKLLTAISGVLMLVFVFLIAKELFDEKIGFLSTLFVAFLPNHIYFSTISYVDTTLALFVIGSIYFALKNKIIWAGIFSGLAMLIKYHGVFGVLVVLFIIYINNRERIMNIVKYSVVTAVIGIWWYIRNWVVLGNPVWDFLNNFFKGHVIEKVVRTPSVLNLLIPNYLITFYLSLFGVPSGDFTSISRLNVPFFWLFATIWIIGTLIYIAPLFFGFTRIYFFEKRWKIITVWLASFLIFSILYIYDQNELYARLLIPVFPVFGILWARGILSLNKIIKKNYIKKALIVLLILVVIGFVAVEFAKATVATNQWQVYEDDFNWIKENTEKDAKILTTPSQCAAYYLHRETVRYDDEIFKEIQEGRSDIGYVFIDALKTRRYERAFPAEFISYLNSKEQVYSNSATGTEVYKIR